MSRFVLTIGDFVARTGVSEPTLRMWERRHGFPAPGRTPSGHRRYSEEQVATVQRMLSLRRSGLSLPASIVRAQQPPSVAEVSLYAALRALRPELEPWVARKSVLVALSRAIEDETLAQAQARTLFGCFQRERFYRRSQDRWRELSQAARLSVVFADFGRPGVHADPALPVEVPIGRRQELAREWSLVFHGGRSSICMVAREVASSSVGAPTAQRRFELLWTVDPDAVVALTRQCLALVVGSLGDQAPVVLGERIAAAEGALASDSYASTAEQLRLTATIFNRTLSRLQGGGVE